jgi:biopolymer transport protein ExbB/TolQ
MSDDQVRDLAGKILARPEYAGAGGVHSKVESWLSRLFEWLLRGLSSIEVLRNTSPLLYWVVVLAVAGVSVALIAHVIWTIWIAMTAPQPVSPARASGSNPTDLSREAEALAASGRYLDAAHRLMLASFRTLAERSVIELRPDRSNRWIRAALRGSTLAENLTAELDALVERTERRWFGDRKNDPEIYARWRTAYEQLSSQVR